jgi:hypothetical protein
MLDAEQERRKEGGEHSWLHYFDASTGERIAAGWSDKLPPEVAAHERPRRYGPDGFRAWSHAGLGYAGPSRTTRRSMLYDPFREQVYPAQGWSVLIRPGRWLVRRRGSEGWELFDPDTEESAPAQGLARLHPDAILDDGRVLACERHESRPFLVEPETGRRSPLDARARFAWILGRFPDGAYLLSLRDGANYRCVRFDPDTLALERFTALGESQMWDFLLVAIVDDRTLLGIRHRREVVRVDRDGNLEVLFPRTSTS